MPRATSCTFSHCERGLLDTTAELNRVEKKHVLFYHKDLELQVRSKSTHKLRSFRRQPQLNMDYVCDCMGRYYIGGSFLRHAKNCKHLNSIANTANENSITVENMDNADIANSVPIRPATFGSTTQQLVENPLLNQQLSSPSMSVSRRHSSPNNSLGFIHHPIARPPYPSSKSPARHHPTSTPAAAAAFCDHDYKMVLKCRKCSLKHDEDQQHRCDRETQTRRLTIPRNDVVLGCIYYECKLPGVVYISW